MALAYHVGDDVIFQTFSVGPQPKPLTEAAEAKESVIGILLKAHPDNTQTVYIGDSNSQPWPLAAGEALSLRLTRRKKIYYSGTAPDRLIVVQILTSGNAGTPYGVR